MNPAARSQDEDEGPPPLIRVRLVDLQVNAQPPIASLSHVYAPPHANAATSFPSGMLPKRVPCVRIFGHTPSNQSVCLNIHGIWPYFFIDYPSERSIEPDAVARHCHRIATSLNSALCQSLRQDEYGVESRSGAGGRNTSTLHVASVMLVKGIPFYGYHVGYRYFLKISLVTQSHVQRAVQLLDSGSIMKRKWVVYETHLATKLQFMIDFDLYGCGWVDLSGGLFRLPLPAGVRHDLEEGILTEDTIPGPNVHPEISAPPKETYSTLEIDALPYHILNRRRLRPRYLHNSLHELLRPDLIDPNAKFVRSVRELWAEEERRRVAKGLPAKEGLIPPTANERRIGLSQADVEWKGGDWDASPRLWQEFVQRLENERRSGDHKNFKLESFGQPERKDHAMWDKWIMTTYESVEAGWPKSERSIRKSRTGSISRSQRSRTQKEQASTPSKAMRNGDSKQMMQDEGDHGEGSEDEAEVNPWEEGFYFSSQTAPTAELNKSKEDVEVAPTQIPLALIQQIEADEVARVEREKAATRTDFDGDFDDRTGPVTPNSKRAGAGAPDDEEGDDEDLMPALTQIGSTRAKGGLLNTPGKHPNRRWERGTPTTPTKAPHGFGPRTPVKNASSPLNPHDSGSTNGSTTPHGKVAKDQDVNAFMRSRLDNVLSTPSSRTVKVGGSSRTRLDTDGKDDPEPTRVDREEGGAAPPTNRMLRFADNVQYEGGGQGAHSSDSDVDMEPPAAQPNFGLKSSDSASDAEAREDRKRTRDQIDNGTSDSDEIIEPTFMDPSDRLAREMVQPDPLPSTSLESTETSSQEPRATKRARFPTEPPSTPPMLPPPSQLDKQPSKASVNSLPSDTTKSDGIPSHLLEPNAWTFATRPPSNAEVLATMEEYGEPNIAYRQPFFSVHKDATFKAKDYGTQTFKIRHDGISQLQPFGHRWAKRRPREKNGKKSRKSRTVQWTYSAPPPSAREVETWAHANAVQEPSMLDTKSRLASQFGGPTQRNKYGFVVSQNQRKPNAQRETQSMSVMALEVFAPSKGRLLPDPENDAVVAIFYCLQDDSVDRRAPGEASHVLPPEYPGSPGYRTGVMLLKDKHVIPARISINEVLIEYFDDENELLQEIISRVRIWNPDVLAGYEVHATSWGYLSQRAHYHLGMDFPGELSRVHSGASGRGGHSDYNRTHTSVFQVSGRHVFNIWRILRGELTLLQYSFENVAFQLMHERIPQYSPSTLTNWYRSNVPADLNRHLQYHIDRVNAYMGMLDKAEVVTKNAEFARVFGVDFNSVMSRGSQFKVESFMFRIAKPESFVLISPSRDEVGKQNAAEAQPLIFEPQSKFYTDPVLVLDFQSLYPSIMIGYNYCYSTCLGRVNPFKENWKLGWRDVRHPPGELELLQDLVTISPNGIIYAKPKLRKSLLAKMLGEILDTRVMVKQGMKLAKGDKGLSQVLNARQLGLKLMANVTYGYTGASFSGRMPCVEIADSIVQTGRETLERAISTIENNSSWGAKVVYGDTDSLFVHLPGKTFEQAFRFGNEMAEAVTASNPRPVKLKFEKVYTKCLLMAKKRYVGFKYESIDEKEPTFDAKGIETIRRDGFPAGQKMVETVIKMLFRTQDLSLIKKYCVDQWSKLKEGRVSIQDFTLAKEVKLGSYSDKGAPQPGVMVASRKLVQDPRDEAEYGQRVPYVIAMGEKHRLAERALAPEEMLNNRNYKLDADYYITRQMIKPINRVLNLVGVDCQTWYDQMPKVIRASDQFRSVGATNSPGKSITLDRHFNSVHCLVCGVKTDKTDICEPCRLTPSTSIHSLMSRFHLAESRLVSAHRICASCSSTPLTEQIRCESTACPVLYARIKAGWESEDVSGIPKLVHSLERQAEGIVEVRMQNQAGTNIQLRTLHELIKELDDGNSETAGSSIHRIEYKYTAGIYSYANHRITTLWLELRAQSPSSELGRHWNQSLAPTLDSSSKMWIWTMTGRRRRSKWLEQASRSSLSRESKLLAQLAEKLKREFDAMYGTTWHCVVGRSFGSFVTHETRNFIYFCLEPISILIWKTS